MIAQLRLLSWIIAGFALAAMLLALQIEKRSHAKSKARVVELSVQLQRISTERNEQAQQTKERIKVVRETVRVAEDKAREIERAPLPGNCQSPKEVLTADI